MNRKFALIPVMPTPNGPLHLGHLAGPFLKMDILARHLRKLGHEVSIVSATDPYETHILPICKQESKNELDVCNEHYESIKKCLDALSIEYDTFINPVDPKYSNKLFEITKEITTQALSNSKYSYIEEGLHRNSRTQEIVVASRIAGICPHCQMKMGGYHCEACGQEVSPDELIEPYDTENVDESLFVDSTLSLFIDANSEYINDKMNQCKVPHNIQKIVHEYIKNHGPIVRLSNPGDWGIKLSDIINTENKSVVFTYTSLICLTILCGEEIKKFLKLDENPLSKESECFVVGSFGFDNTVPFCLSVPTLAQLSNSFRGFDYYLTNFFYTLDGEKFSTSRRHCIWGYDALTTLGTTSDILRLYLSITSPENQKTNFSNEEFKIFNIEIESFISSINHLMILDNLCIENIISDENFNQNLKKINSALNIDEFSLQIAGKTVYEWIMNSEIEHNIKIIGFAILANSIMPDISNKIIMSLDKNQIQLLNAL